MEKRMDSPKTGFTTIDEYIATFPLEIQTILQTVRSTIRDVVPDAEEKISYQMPTFYLHGNLVHFAAFKNHIGFYPTPTGVDAFQERLSLYKGAKGSVQFPLDQPMPLDLMRDITLYRVDENMKKAAAKSKKKK
jgi:uncharacterized protein YdhG (YjbR/CyaY superfamily)